MGRKGGGDGGGRQEGMGSRWEEGVRGGERAEKGEGRAGEVEGPSPSLFLHVPPSPSISLPLLLLPIPPPPSPSSPLLSLSLYPLLSPHLPLSLSPPFPSSPSLFLPVTPPLTSLGHPR